MAFASGALQQRPFCTAVSQTDDVQRMSFRGSPAVHSAPASQPLASCCRNLRYPPCSTSTAISHNGVSSALPCPRRMTFSACRSAIRRLCTQLQPHSQASGFLPN